MRVRPLSVATSISVQKILAGIGSLEQPKNVHQSGLTRTGTTANGYKLAMLNNQGNRRDGMHNAITDAIAFAEIG